MPLVVHADHVFTGDEAPLRDGAVLVDERGAVLDVGPAVSMRTRHQGAEVRRVEGMLLPGLVNAHTHVELSSLHGQVPGGRGFLPWVDALVGLRTEVVAEDEARAIDEAVRGLAAAGTVAVGDVTNGLAAVDALARHGIGGSVFHEVFGVVRDAVLARVEGLESERRTRVPAWPTDLAWAPAPHTLYTTHEDAVRGLVAQARARGVRTSLHFGEHEGERLALEQGSGTVPAWLTTRTRHERTWPQRPLVDVARELGVLAADVLLVHLTCLREEEIAEVVRAGAPAVLCPRSNLHIEGRMPDLPTMRRLGLEPALGTDSLASNASLDVLAEAATLRARFADVPAWELLRMATANGARALGRPDLGRLARGARPGLLAIATPGGATDPAASALDDLTLPRRFVVPRHTEIPA